LDWLATNAEIVDSKLEGAGVVVRFPQEFSFIDSPDESLETLWELVAAARAGAHRVSIDQSSCHSIDLCAASVLNVLAVDAKLRVKTSFEGRFPDGEEMRDIVLATGLPRVLGLDLPVPENFKSFELRKGGSPRHSLLKSTKKERVAAELTRYLADIFSGKNFKLSRKGRRSLGNLVGEVLGNAEDHAGGQDWWVCAYLRQLPDKTWGDCHMTFFNFGPSLSDSLQGLEDPALRQEAEELVRHHVLTDPKLSAENVWSVLALQEGMTRFFEGDGPRRRGFGTADIITAFQVLGGTTDPDAQPEMCLVSGRTHIRFDPKYLMAPQPGTGGSSRRIIAFNHTNDIRIAPDSKVVTPLVNRFPGTLLSLRFFVQKEYLERLEVEYGSADA